MPVGPYADFAACVAANQDKDNPEAYCQALEHAGADAPVEKGKKGALRKIFEGLASVLGDEADVVKGVGDVADAFERTARDAGGRIALTKSVPILKIDAEERMVYGIVYEPDVPDAHGDVMSAAEIRKAAHGFMIRYATLEGDTGVEHTAKTGRHQLPIVESFIAPADFTLGTQQIRKGTWVMAGKVLDDQLWKGVKGGRYTGWSFEGFGRRVA